MGLPEAPGRERTRTSTSSVIIAETLEDQCKRSQEEWTTAEHQKMASEYQSYAGVDRVTRAMGPQFYAMVTTEKSPVEAMIDSGSSATLISFKQFKKIGLQARIPSEELLLPGITLRDYNQSPIPIGAHTEVTFGRKGRTVTTTAYIRSDLASGEPCLLGTNMVMPLKLNQMVPNVGVEGTAEVRGLVETGLPTVFEPSNALITEPGLYLEDSLVDPDPDGRVCLVIHNSTGETKQLMSETALGVVEQCNESESQYHGLAVLAIEARIDLVKEDVEAGDQLVETRKKRLNEVVCIWEDGFSEDKAISIRNCVLQAVDNFAMEEDELGEVGR